MTSSVLCLYAAVLVPIFSEWIRKEDLCFLDSAMCSQELRNRFLDMLYLCQNCDLVSNNSKAFEWMLLRGLHVKKLKVTSWSSVVEGFIESKQLLSMRVELDLLALHLDKIQTNVNDIRVNLPFSFNASQLKIAGPMITELSFIDKKRFIDTKNETVQTIAACCPNLKKVYAPQWSFLLPLVDACLLDTINMRHLSSLIWRGNCFWSYSCSLQRTSIIDDSAVCLGEEKYYHLTILQCGHTTREEDLDLLTPLMPNLERLYFDKNKQLTIMSEAVKRCCKLTHLEITSLIHLREFKQLLQRSPLLRRVSVVGGCTVNVDECIVAMAECCPLLEACHLKNCAVSSQSAMSEFFERCHYLSEFSADSWPCDAVLPIAVNCESLAVGTCMLVCKSGRGLRKVGLPKQVSKGVLCTIFAQNPDIRSIHISDWFGILSGVIVTMVQCCPSLTNFVATFGKMHVDTTVFEALGHLQHLNFLALRDIRGGLSVESLSAMLMNKSQSLHSLALIDCGVTGNMLPVISSLCLGLTKLDLKGNKGIENDIADLKNSSPRLRCVF